MKKRVFILCSLLFVLVLSACGASDDKESDQQAADDKVWENIKETGKITVGTSGTLYPASYYPEGSDEISGYDVEVVKEIAKRLDLEVEFKTSDFNNMLASVQNGRVDMAANDIGITDERKEKFAYSEPYKYSYTTMIVRKDDLSGIESLSDLKGKKAGGEATTGYSKIAERLGAEVVAYGNTTNDVYLRDVDNGRTDLIINDYYLQSLALQAFPDFNITIHPDFKFDGSANAVIMSNDAAELKAQVDKVLGEMKEDGTLTELSKKFFDGADVSKEPEEDIPSIDELVKQQEDEAK
ncbi:transporter substrate-binding domain-containing protein [Terribacillus sp. DMT04]|uniref:transporter substrate-binding domain-containing protein n=1 Tax=Terribacillus sp. DMT04 TaxID=2850441 RepID=UPI001C2BBBDF|nr:transporter substrate-binding domain-containing protein [Terribacillus sp. DMT04]QXE02476.1 transporter substrate-binding domain-containing protein [Terribacillus sp. DMT04]